jgi:ATP-dependent Clp protease adaptor protein ClpS
MSPAPDAARAGPSMSDIVVKSETRLRPARPPLYRVLLLNDDFTPRDFVRGG